MTTAHEGHAHGMTVNGFVSVSLEPPLVLVSLRTNCRMVGLLRRSGRYGVSVLAEHHEETRSYTPAVPWKTSILPATTRSSSGGVEHLDDRGGRPLLFFAGGYAALRAQVEEDAFTV